MGITDLTRRSFLAVGTAAPMLAQAAEEYRRPAGTMPTRILGKTGVRVSAISLGCGSGAITDYPSDEMAAQFIHQCLDAGINYIDTAALYGRKDDDRNSERRLGKALAGRRSQVYLNTKTLKRKSDEAMRDIETSLKLLQTDRLDGIQIHWIQEGKDDLAALGAGDGVYTLLRKLRDQKVIRFIGVTTHNWVDGLSRIVDMYDFDTVLMPLNAVKSRGDYEGTVLPKLLDKKIGVLAMKVLGGMGMNNRIAVESAPAKLVGTEVGKTSASTLLRYALSLPIHSAEIGIGDYRQLTEDLNLVYNFKPMSESERKTLAYSLRGSATLMAYTQPGYTHG